MTSKLQTRSFTSFKKYSVCLLLIEKTRAKQKTYTGYVRGRG
jgi:hypothetical protein